MNIFWNNTMTEISECKEVMIWGKPLNMTCKRKLFIRDSVQLFDNGSLLHLFIYLFIVSPTSINIIILYCHSFLFQFYNVPAPSTQKTKYA